MSLKIDLRVPPCEPAPQVAAFVAQCEEAGFDGVGLLDSQLLERDVFVSMASAVQATSRVRVASAVTNPVTRHLSVLASAAMTVSELAPGRVEIWMGRGYSSVQTIGIAPATVREMRQAVITLKQLMSGEEVTFDGVTSRLRHGGSQIPPVYVSATGPRAIQVAGEVADGVVLMVGLHPSSLELARGYLAEGAKKSGRDPSEVEIILTSTTIIKDDLQEARELARPLCVQRLMEDTHYRWLEAAGINPRGMELPRELWDLYPDIPHAEDWEKAQRLCAFLPDDMLAQMCDTIGLIGTPEYCAQRLRQAEADGIEHIYLMTGATYEFAHEELKAFKDVIFPALKQSVKS